MSFCQSIAVNSISFSAIIYCFLLIYTVSLATIILVFFTTNMHCFIYFYYMLFFTTNMLCFFYYYCTVSLLLLYSGSFSTIMYCLFYCYYMLFFIAIVFFCYYTLSFTSIMYCFLSLLLYTVIYCSFQCCFFSLTLYSVSFTSIIWTVSFTRVMLFLFPRCYILFTVLLICTVFF